MSKELVVSSNRHETKVAILEDDQLVEIYFQRAHEYSLGREVSIKAVSPRVLSGNAIRFRGFGAGAGYIPLRLRLLRRARGRFRPRRR